MNNDYNIESNNAWKNIGRTPFVTVVTPVYNREDTIFEQCSPWRDNRTKIWSILLLMMDPQIQLKKLL